MSETTPKVYEAIRKVTEDLSHIGISKDRKNTQQGYAFRGIDDVYCSLSPLLAKHGLCILPRVISRDQVERQTKSGGVLFYTTLVVEFDFVSSVDGSKHTVCTIGEAMDSADKSSPKAMSTAYKYAAFQAFAIPTEGDNDTENNSPELAPQRTVVPPKATPRKAPEKPAETPKSQFVNDYEPVSKFFHDAGCKSADDATLVAKFCCASANLSKAQKDAAHAKEIYTGIEMALIEHKTPSAVLAAAKKLASSPV